MQMEKLNLLSLPKIWYPVDAGRKLNVLKTFNLLIYVLYLLRQN